MCRLLYRTYFCETEEAGPPAHHHDAVWPEEQCADARRHGLDHCDNLKPGISDYRDQCYAPSCCRSRIRNALYNWGVTRLEAGGGYDQDTHALGQYAMSLAFEHGRSCGFRQDDFVDLRKEVLREFELSDDRLSRSKVPAGHPMYRW